MKKLRLLMLAPAVLALGMGLSACGDDDDDDDFQSDVEGARETLGTQVGDTANDLADDLDSAADNVQSTTSEQADDLKSKCDDFAGQIPIAAVRQQAQNLCGELEDALNSQNGDRLRDLADTIRSLVS